jgi:hypothetical protein
LRAQRPDALSRCAPPKGNITNLRIVSIPRLFRIAQSHDAAFVISEFLSLIDRVSRQPMAPLTALIIKCDSMCMFCNVQICQCPLDSTALLQNENYSSNVAGRTHSVIEFD